VLMVLLSSPSGPSNEIDARSTVVQILGHAHRLRALSREYEGYSVHARSSFSREIRGRFRSRKAVAWASGFDPATTGRAPNPRRIPSRRPPCR